MAGPLSYLPNIPASTDQLSVSQGNIQNNFGALQTWIDQNHVDYSASANQPGKHTFVQMPGQAGTPSGGFLATETALYTGLTTAPLVTGVNEMLLVKQDGTTIIPITASTQAQNGWAFLPSGIILKWGFKTIGGTGSAPLLITFPTGASIQEFTNCFNVQVTGAYNSSTTANTAAPPQVSYSTAPTATGFTLTWSGGSWNSSTAIYYFAIGN